MNNRSNLFAGLFIAIGLILLGGSINRGIKSFKMLDRSVVVKGLSEIEMPSDHVIWPITFYETGNDLQAVYTTIERKNQIIMQFLNSNGIDESEINFSAPAINDRQATEYNPQLYIRYNVKSVVTVSSKKIDIIRKLIITQSELIKQGIAIAADSWEHRTNFQFTKLNEVKPQMIEDATKNARASAEKFAEDSGSKLGKIKSAYQGQFSIEDRDESTPYLKVLRVVTTVEYMLED